MKSFSQPSASMTSEAGATVGNSTSIGTHQATAPTLPTQPVEPSPETVVRLENPPVPQPVNHEYATGEKVAQIVEHTTIEALSQGKDPLDALAQVEENPSTPELPQDVQKDPEYQKALGEALIQAEQENQPITHDALHEKALKTYISTMQEKTINSVLKDMDHTNKVSITESDMEDVSQQIKIAFEKDPIGMLKAMHKAKNLAEAYVAEKELKENPSATEQEQHEIAEKIQHLEENYSDFLHDFAKTLGKDGAKLVIVLQDLPDNPLLLEMVRKKVKKLTIWEIIKIIFMLLMSLSLRVLETTQKETERH